MFQFRNNCLVCLCDIRILVQIIDEDTEYYLTPNVWMIVIYDKGNSHCQICQFCVVAYLRKTLSGEKRTLERED